MGFYYVSTIELNARIVVDMFLNLSKPDYRCNYDNKRLYK